MPRGVEGLVSNICEKPSDPYQPTASCSPNYCWCDNYSPSLISHLIAEVYFLLSRAQFNFSKPSPSPSLTSAPQLWSYLRGSAGGTGRDHTEAAVCHDKLLKRRAHKTNGCNVCHGLWATYCCLSHAPCPQKNQCCPLERRDSGSDDRRLLFAASCLLFGA